jgi:opacity protein-like surface antigen
MLGQRFNISALTALAVLFAGTVAQAADYPPPPPVVVQQEFGSNWYLRGQVGVGMIQSDKMEYQHNPANNPNDFTVDSSSIADTYFIGGGVGYNWNDWLRFDVTAEYRSKANVNALGTYTTACTDALGNPVATCIDTYQGYLKSWVFLANAYVDLGTWQCFTPFVGAGIGGAYNSLVDFSDLNTTNGGRGYGRNSSNWSFAWALYAGVAYNVSKNLKVDLSYRYLNYGSVTDPIDCVGGCNADSYKFGNLHSNDIMLGLRWNCCELPPPPRYIYRPPPPISSRG